MGRTRNHDANADGREPQLEIGSIHFRKRARPDDASAKKENVRRRFFLVRGRWDLFQSRLRLAGWDPPVGSASHPQIVFPRGTTDEDEMANADDRDGDVR